MNTWTRSTYCSGGSCIEARVDGGGVQIRNSARPDEQPLLVTYDEWDAFVAGIRADEFNANHTSS